MTTRREAARRVEEDIAKARVPPQDNQAPLQEKAPTDDQDPFNPSVMNDGEIRMSLLNLEQAITTQAQVVLQLKIWLLA